MAQPIDTDIDLALDDPDTETYAPTAWGRLVNLASAATIAPVAAAVYADLNDQQELLNVSLVIAAVFIALAVAALVMEYRGDHR